MADDDRADGPPLYRAPSADGHVLRWERLGDDTTELGSTSPDASIETLTVRWENEAWTASGVVGREQVEYVLRISPTWQIRQFLLFRDLDEPDLWLGADGAGRWGEVNGAHRPELRGCVSIDLTCSPFPLTPTVRSLGLEIGGTAALIVARIDVETLDVQPVRQRFTRLAAHRWRVEDADDTGVEFEVDQYGFVIDLPGRHRRLDE